MKNNNTNIVKDLKNLLDDYMTKASSREFIKKLEKDNSVYNNDVSDFTKLDKSQVEYEVPKGIDYRVMVDKMITHCENDLPEEKYYNLLLDLSQLMLHSGEVSFSLEIAENLLSKLNTDNKNVSFLAEANLMVSKIYWSQAIWDDCNYYVSKAMQLYLSISNEHGIAKCENMLGTLYGEKGEFEKALQYLENALAHLKEENDLATRAVILTNLGVIYTINGDFEKAVWNLKTAIEKLESLNDTRRASRVYHNIGMLFTRMGKYDEALDEFNKCISHSLDNDYLSNCAIAYVGKAYIYTKLKNSALADAYTDKAMEIAYKINDTLSIADIYKIKGMIQTEMDNFQLSEEFFENSIRLNKDLENKLNVAESSAELGKLLKNNEREEEAKPYLDSAVRYYKEIKDEDIVSQLVEKQN
ncbi:MAG: tetratricopeptide repeat protein [Ignavibacteriaceae bacterium]